MVDKKPGLKRQIHPMPDYVKRAIEERGLMDDYEKRPAYQKNDYIGWINQAMLKETKEKRLKLLSSQIYPNTYRLAQPNAPMLIMVLS